MCTLPIMSTLEFRIVGSDGIAVDEGLDVAWVIYETREAALETLKRVEDDDPHGAPYRIEEREVGDWRAA